MTADLWKYISCLMVIGSALLLLPDQNSLIFVAMFKAKPILQATMLPERKAIYLSIVDAAVQVGIRVHSVYSLFSTHHIFVIFFTRAKFLDHKIYTEKRQFFASNL